MDTGKAELKKGLEIDIERFFPRAVEFSHRAIPRATFGEMGLWSTVFVIVSLITLLLHRMEARAFQRAWSRSAKTLVAASVALVFTVPMVRAKDSACKNPDLLAAAVLDTGGLIHNAHPNALPDAQDQFDYEPSYYSVIANTEIGSDTLYGTNGKTYRLGWEQVVRDFLDRGGKTGFVKGTDTHEGKPAARTAVFAKELTREAIFDALRHRRNYAVSNMRIILDFKINGRYMGEEIEIKGKPRIAVSVKATDTIKELAIIRDGSILYSVGPESNLAEFEFVDNAFEGDSYYYLRVTQVDKDKLGNPSRAWSSPIWVRSRR